jgi:hypothetical protein
VTAASSFWARTSGKRIWHGGRLLNNSRQFKVADVLALVFAAGILAVFEWLHHAEFPPTGPRFLTALAITAGFALLA